MRNAVAGLFKLGAWVVWVVGGIWGFFLCLRIIHAAAGFWGVVAAFFLGPVTFVAAPWYALFEWGTWVPLVICYGAGVGGGILFGIGSVLSDD